MIEYPKLREKFGSVVPYEDDPVAHIKVEFGFDVLQVARGNYAPQSYHDFIGFKVATGVLGRAVHDTYSLELADLFDDLDLALGTYRRTVSSIIPEMTKVAWVTGPRIHPVKQGTSRQATGDNSITCRLFDPIYQGWIRTRHRPVLGPFLIRSC